MAIPWNDGVRQRRQLAIYVSPSLGGSWAAMFREARDAFNALSRHHGLGVTLSRAAAAPADDGGGGDVAVSTAAGQVTLDYGGARQDRAFSGTIMHGLTLQASRGGSIEKAFVYLPAHPQVNTPAGMRPVGPPVMRLIAVHELVHVCGLENRDHSTDDLFQGTPQVDPGTHPAQDRIRIGTGYPMRWMPPLVLGGTTVGRIRGLWC